MCELCVDAIKQHWHDLPESDWFSLLMGATCWPLGDGEEVARQVKEMAERSGCDLGLALVISDTELILAMEKAERMDSGGSPGQKGG